jgi:spermidine synthase
VIPGDARLSLERELERHEQQDFDVLVLDAFSGDAIPVHLLTLEAFEIYLRHLKNPSGILAIHISNTYLDLRAVVFAAARRLGLKAVWIHSAADGRISSESNWVLLSRADTLPESDATVHGVADQVPYVPTIRPWTDDYSNLLQILNR